MVKKVCQYLVSIKSYQCFWVGFFMLQTSWTLNDLQFYCRRVTNVNTILMLFLYNWITCYVNKNQFWCPWGLSVVKMINKLANTLFWLYLMVWVKIKIQLKYGKEKQRNKLNLSQWHHRDCQFTVWLCFLCNLENYITSKPKKVSV